MKKNIKSILVLIFLGMAALSYSLDLVENTPSVDSNRLVSWQKIYQTTPSLSSCKEGILSDSEKGRILDRVNYIRELHQLPPVAYQPSNGLTMEKAALLSAANNEDDVDNFRYCITEPFRKLIQESLSENLIRYGVVYQAVVGSTNTPINSVESAYFIDSLLQDTRRKNEFSQQSYSLYSREILLYPFLSSIDFGRADGIPPYTITEIPDLDGEFQEINTNYVANIVVKPQSFKQSALEMPWGAVAYPYLDYPRELFQENEYARGYPVMSFSVVADRNNRNNNKNIDFSQSFIEIRNEENNLVLINSKAINKSRVGLGSILFWRVDDKLENNKHYKVKIGNVKVNNRLFDYNYWFRLK